MTYKSADNVVEQSTTTTTGAYQLGGVPSSGEQPGVQTFVSGIGSTNSCDYYASEVAGTAWERGIGTVTSGSPSTLSRDTITGSSNSGSAVDWTGKTLRVRCILPARRVNNASSNILENLTIVTSRASNAETISLKTLYGTDPAANDPVRIGFVDPSTGAFFLREITAATSLTISSGSTLGATSAEPFRVWVVLFDDAGTLRLGAIKCYTGTGIVGLEDNGVASSTAISGSANSAGVFYTGTAVTSKPYRILGRLDYTLTTAGTWVTAPTIKLFSQGSKLPGDVVQRQIKGYSAYSAPGGTIPADDTIPQNTEGAEFMATDSLSPSASANVLKVTAEANVFSSTAGNLIGALFRDSTADAFFAGVIYLAATNYSGRHVFSPPFFVAGSTSATVVKYRAGMDAGTLNFNGTTARILGACNKSSISIEEIMV